MQKAFVFGYLTPQVLIYYIDSNLPNGYKDLPKCSLLNMKKIPRKIDLYQRYLGLVMIRYVFIYGILGIRIDQENATQANSEFINIYMFTISKFCSTISGDLTAFNCVFCIKIQLHSWFETILNFRSLIECIFRHSSRM